MKTLTRLKTLFEVDETLSAFVSKSRFVDHFAAHDQEHEITAAIYDRWSGQVKKSLAEIQHLGVGVFLGFSWKPTPDEVMNVLDRNLSGTAITDGLADAVAPHLKVAFNKGQDATLAKFRQSDRKQKDFQGVGFAQITGITEDHALQALLDQTIVAAGGFWDERLSDSIKTEINNYFLGTETRDELVSKIESTVNDRLEIGGAKSLPTSYFDNLSTHQIVRSRNIGSYYRAKSLGAIHYTLRNPHDARTSPICEAVTQGQIWTMQGAEETIVGLVSARTLSDVKTVAPFYKNGKDVKNPVPPLHFPKCRTVMDYVF